METIDTIFIIFLIIVFIIGIIINGYLSYLYPFKNKKNRLTNSKKIDKMNL